MFYHRKEVLPQSVCECVKDGHMEKQDILERIYEALEILYFLHGRILEGLYFRLQCQAFFV